MFGLRCRYLVLLLAVALPALAPRAARGQYFSFGKNKIQYEAHDWRYLQSKHFDVYYYEGGEALAAYTARAAEDAYAEIRQLLGVELSHRVPILVYQGHGTFAATNAVDLPARSTGVAGATELLKNRVVLPFAGNRRAFRQTLHHELVHAVLNDVLYGGSLLSLLRNDLQLDLPLWFSEGLAEYAAVGWSARADLYVRDAVLRGALPPLDRLYGFMAYKGGQRLWDYVAEQYGRGMIGEILGRLRQTRSVEESFEQATGLSLAVLSERWHRALREIYFPGMTARQDLSAIARPLNDRTGEAYQLRPALSPDGSRLAYLTVQGGRFEVHLARTSDGQSLGTLIEGQTSAAFERLRPQTPGLAWGPYGRRIALVTAGGASDAVAVINVRTRAVTRYRIPGLDQILAAAWSPGGGRLAISAVQGGQSDLYVLDLATHEVINYTNDAFSDLAPVWSPGGGALVFHSDRGAHLRLGTRAALSPDADASLQFDLYRLVLKDAQGGPHIERLTCTPYADETDAHFGPDGEQLAFRSDRNGIFNLYAMELSPGRKRAPLCVGAGGRRGDGAISGDHEGRPYALPVVGSPRHPVTGARPLTNLTRGILQMDISAGGSRAAVVSLREGRPAIYLMQAPFTRTLGPDPPRPTVWAQRRQPSRGASAPALALASDAVRRANPFLRDAAGAPPPRRLASVASTSRGGRNASSAAHASSDSASAWADGGSGYGGVRITFQDDAAHSDEDSGHSSEHASSSPASSAQGPFTPRENRTPDGSFKTSEYKLYFSPDLIYGTTGYDALYGVQGLLQMRFSDMMGNHRIFASTNLLVDLRNADYLISYSYLPRRIDWQFSIYHTARLLPDYDRERYFRYRRYGTSVRATYPLDLFHRVAFDAGVVGVSQVDIGNPTGPARVRVFFRPSVTFTRDVTTPGPFAPRGGHRLAVRLSGGVGPFHFVSVLADARTYTSLGSDGRYTVAARLSGGVSVGSTRQLFYTAGVTNWLNRRFDPQSGLPINNLSDFAFATPVLPLRGHALNARNGSQFTLLNLELRFPLRVSPLTDLLSVLPLRGLRGVLFLDAGAVWGPDEGLTFFRENAAGERVFGDLLVGVGGGVRTLVLGYPLRVDVAWPFDGHHFGQPRLYLSVGFGF